MGVPIEGEAIEAGALGTVTVDRCEVKIRRDNGRTHRLTGYQLDRLMQGDYDDGTDLDGMPLNPLHPAYRGG